VCDVSRNIPDEVLQHVGTGPGQRDAVVMVRSTPPNYCIETRIDSGFQTQVNFVPEYVSVEPTKVDLKDVIDHIEHIASVIGRKQCVSLFYSLSPRYVLGS
jgi:membrane dipeptidase